MLLRSAWGGCLEGTAGVRAAFVACSSHLRCPSHLVYFLSPVVIPRPPGCCARARCSPPRFRAVVSTSLPHPSPPPFCMSPSFPCYTLGYAVERVQGRWGPREGCRTHTRTHPLSCTHPCTHPSYPRAVPRTRACALGVFRGCGGSCVWARGCRGEASVGSSEQLSPAFNPAVCSRVESRGVAAWCSPGFSPLPPTPPGPTTLGFTLVRLCTCVCTVTRTHLLFL